MLSAFAYKVRVAEEPRLTLTGTSGRVAVVAAAAMRKGLLLLRRLLCWSRSADCRALRQRVPLVPSGRLLLVMAVAARRAGAVEVAGLVVRRVALFVRGEAATAALESATAIPEVRAVAGIHFLAGAAGPEVELGTLEALALTADSSAAAGRDFFASPVRFEAVRGVQRES